MTDLPDHHCPACGARQKSFPRYPWHLCNACRKTAVDGAGRALDFANVSLSGGFMFRYTGDSDDSWVTCRGVIARIAGRPVLIHEARFGGVVAEPVPDLPWPDAHVHDLRGQHVAKLKPPR